MDTAKRTLVTAGLVLALLALGGEGMAFDYAGQAWCCDTAFFCINYQNPTSSCGSPRSDFWFAALVESSAVAWNELGTQFKLVPYCASILWCEPYGQICRGIKDGYNNVSMSSGCSWQDNSIIAYSTWWYWTEGDTAGCIFEGDVCFNDNVSWYNDSGLCSGNCYDLQSVATHELGHWIAGGHENDTAVLGYRPIMYYAFNFCEQRRTITPDDSALVKWAYDWYSTIALPACTVAVHHHPPYPARPPHRSCVSPIFSDHVVCEPQGGDNPNHPPTYWYTVIPSEGGRCDFHVKVFDSVLDNYSNWVGPPNWTHQLHKVGDEWWVSWLDLGCANAIFSLFTFQFDNPNSADWGHWITSVYGVDNPYQGIVDLSAGHTGQSDGYGYRVHVPRGCCQGIRGNVDGDVAELVNIVDLTYLVAHLFGGGPAPPCREEGDINADGSVNIVDLTYLVAYLFGGGAPPAPC